MEPTVSTTVPCKAPTRQEAMMMLADIGQGPERSEKTQQLIMTK
jgi:hypothetical protein